jgi:hypothetical protein
MCQLPAFCRKLRSCAVLEIVVSAIRQNSLSRIPRRCGRPRRRAETIPRAVEFFKAPATPPHIKNEAINTEAVLWPSARFSCSSVRNSTRRTFQLAPVDVCCNQPRAE